MCLASCGVRTGHRSLLSAVVVIGEGAHACSRPGQSQSKSWRSASLRSQRKRADRLLGTALHLAWGAAFAS